MLNISYNSGHQPGDGIALISIVHPRPRFLSRAWFRGLLWGWSPPKIAENALVTATYDPATGKITDDPEKPHG